jgi:hypothetical protein
MDISDCWRSGRLLGGWLNASSRFEPVVHIQGNAPALESLADIMRRLARAPVGERVMIDTMTGLTGGEIALALENTNQVSQPPALDLLETRVEVPDEGDMVLWAQVPEKRREDVVRALVSDVGHTSLQAREAISRTGILTVRLGGDLAVRLRGSLRRMGVQSALFEMRS